MDQNYSSLALTGENLGLVKISSSQCALSRQALMYLISYLSPIFVQFCGNLAQFVPNPTSLQRRVSVRDVKFEIQIVSEWNGPKWDKSGTF